MSYTTFDFAESLDRVGVSPQDIAVVIMAWGFGDGMGEDSGTGWSPQGVSDWQGGFFFRMKDGRYGYVTGWCDYTGWGCQDGAELTWFTKPQAPGDLRGHPDTISGDGIPVDAWDHAPADLNRWLETGAKSPYDIAY